MQQDIAGLLPSIPGRWNSAFVSEGGSSSSSSSTGGNGSSNATSSRSSSGEKIEMAGSATVVRHIPAATDDSGAADRLELAEQLQQPFDSNGAKSPVPPVMPLPQQLQLLASATAAECAAAGIVIITYRQKEAAQVEQQLSHMLQHVAAVGFAALDCEFGHDDGSSSSSSSSTCSSDDDDDPEAVAVQEQQSSMHCSGQLPAAHNGGQQHLHNSSWWQLALVQLMVPAVTTADGSWPATVYLVRVPQQQNAAQQVLTQLKAMLEDADVLKIVHDGRLVSGQALHLAITWANLSLHPW
jgi:hypothetical protein